jgi:mRNA-degrading endonuclease RelE of RelBE toxin-antitoxin system
MENTFNTTWTDEQLFKLSNRENHKIVRLRSGDYSWKHNIDGTWVDHYFTTFDDYNKPAHFMQYNLIKWRGELSGRQTETAKRYQIATRRLGQIKNSITRTTADKIKEICGLGLNLSQRELADELGVHLRTVTRALAGEYTEVPNQFGVRKPRVHDSRLVYNINDSQKVRTKSKEYLDYVAVFKKKILSQV